MESMSAPLSDADTRDPYATLGITSDTPFNEIKVVYRRLVRELHPDVNPDDPRARDRFDAIQLAFERVRALHIARRPAPTTSFDTPSPTGSLSDTPFDPFATGTFPGTGSISPEVRAGARQPMPSGQGAGTAPVRPGSESTNGTRAGTSPVGSGELQRPPGSGTGPLTAPVPRRAHAGLRLPRSPPSGRPAATSPPPWGA